MGVANWMLVVPLDYLYSYTFLTLEIGLVPKFCWLFRSMDILDWPKVAKILDWPPLPYLLLFIISAQTYLLIRFVYWLHYVFLNIIHNTFRIHIIQPNLLRDETKVRKRTNCQIASSLHNFHVWCWVVMYHTFQLQMEVLREELENMKRGFQLET